MFKRILVPVDFSGSAEAALATTREHYPDATVRLLHIISPKRVAAYYLDTLTSPVDVIKARKALQEEAQGNLRELACQGDDCVAMVGEPADTILNQIESWRPDLVVMGTHGRTGLAHFLNGSVAEEVVRHARVPVLVVHEQANSAKTEEVEAP